MRYNVAASLDGYIATAEGGYDWIPGDVAVDFGAIFARVDTVLRGRRSYQATGGSGPWRLGTRVYVFSTTLVPSEHPGVQVVSSGAAAVVAALMAESGDGEIWLFGGGTCSRLSSRRLTNAHSKKLENHGHALALHYMYYNFCRKHETLTKAKRGVHTTPAIAAGVASHVWKVSEVVALLEAKESARS